MYIGNFDMRSNLYAKSAQFYDLVLNASNPAIANDIDFYKRLIKPKTKVLDIGCGTGRVSIELYKHGCFITGIDLSEAMLSEFEKKLQQSPDMQAHINLHLADMTSFDLEKVYDWIIFPFRVFQGLKNDEQRRACLQATRHHMGVKSRAIISMFNPSPEILAMWGKKGIIDFEIDLPGTKRKLRRIQNQIDHDPKIQAIVVEHVYQIIDNQDVLEEYPDRLDLGYLYPEQASQLFISSGFVIDQIYGGYDFRPFQPEIKKEQIYILKIAK